VKVLLVNLPVVAYHSLEEMVTSNNTDVNKLVMPLGLMYLSSYLKKERPGKDQISILDYNLHCRDIGRYQSVQEFAYHVPKQELLHTTEVDIIGVSLNFSTSYRFFAEASAVLKAQFGTEVKIIVGGSHATNTTAQLLELESVNHVARGEAERGFASYVEQMEAQQRINVVGIYGRDTARLDVPLENCEPIVDLDDIPLPDFDLIDMETYTGFSERKRLMGSSPEGARSATLMTSRGCVFRCTFCASHTISGRTMRYRSDANVLKEIDHLYRRYGVTLFIPEDDLFTANKPRVLSLLAQIRRLDIPNFEIQFPNALSINTLNEPVMDALIDSGMAVAQLAIESGSPYVQKHIIKKNCKLDKAIEVVRYLKSKDIIVRCYYVMGFPDETLDQLNQSIEYAKNLGADWSSFNIATPLVGTEMYQQYVDRGVIKDGSELWSQASYARRTFDTPEFSADFINDFVYRANLQVNFLHNPNLENGRPDIAIKLFSDVLESFPWHIFALQARALATLSLGRSKSAMKDVDQISWLIENDDRSRRLFDDYPEFLFQGKFHHLVEPEAYRVGRPLDNPHRSIAYAEEKGAVLGPDRDKRLHGIV
jgi:anaerobic magnesium-protoporphyrin IX monomethyl ester cyclase